MKFEEVIVALKQGKKVRRMTWANIDSDIKYMEISENENCLPKSYSFTTWHKDGSGHGRYTFDLLVDDIFVDDWEIYDSKADKEKSSYLEGWRNGYEQARQENKDMYKYIDEKMGEFESKVTVAIGKLIMDYKEIKDKLPKEPSEERVVVDD